MRKKHIALAILLLTAGIVGNEVHKVVSINYKMTTSEVASILGKGQSMASGFCVNGYNSLFGRIVVHFSSVIKDGKCVDDGVISACVSNDALNVNYIILPPLDSMTCELANWSGELEPPPSQKATPRVAKTGQADFEETPAPTRPEKLDTPILSNPPRQP